MNTLEKIEAKVKQKEAQRSRLKQLEELKLNDFVEDNDLTEIEKEIQNLKNVLNLKAEKNIDDLDNLFDKFDLDVKKIENTKFEYLYPNFMVKNEITMFAAPPSSGKSLVSVALCNMFLSQNKIETIIYFDADNGSATIKERNIHKIKQKFDKRFRYFHESSASKSQMIQIIKQLQKTDLNDVFIVFDSIKNFMMGADRDKNKDVSKVMEVLQSLRARGATVLFLHHTNKPQKDIELIYAGSSAFQEDTGNAYILQKNDFKNSFIFKKFKERTGDLKNAAFKYDADSHTLSQVDFTEASETEEIAEINDLIIEFLEKQTQKPTYSQIMQHLQKQNYARNKSNQALQTGKGRYWQEEKLTQNNKSVYSLIEEMPIEIIYQNEDKIKEQRSKVDRTSDTSRTSPFYGVSVNDTTLVQVRTSGSEYG
jgi:replicative DNA helicase